MRTHLIAAFAGVLAFSACTNDVLTPADGLSDEERADLLTLVGELAFFDDDFGDEGVPTSAPASFEGRIVSAGPQNWGRRRGRPVNREIFRIEMDSANGLVTLTKELEFDGEFLVLDTATGQIIRKNLRETRSQTATFRRLDRARPDEESGKMHRWNLVAISPAEYAATDVANQLVGIDSITALVNGEVVMTVTDPSELIRIEDRIARLSKDSSIEIRAFVSNATVDQFDAGATFVYLHLRNAAVDLRRWRRMPMDYVTGVGAYVANWTVRHRGRERIVVDALDAETVSPVADAPYYSNIWGIPYRTAVLRDSPS